jgi:hypothetical protein
LFVEQRRVALFGLRLIGVGAHAPLNVGTGLLVHRF